jgi:hypothetical protein
VLCRGIFCTRPVTKPATPPIPRLMAAQVIKVDDTCFVKIINRPMDELVILSQWYFGGRSCCSCCRRGLQQGHDTSLLQCPKCQVANYW